MKTTKYSPFVLSLLVSCLVACSQPTDEPSAEVHSKPEVWTSFYPITTFAQDIAGDKVAVHCPLPEDADPIYWKPNTDDILGFQAADLILKNGAGFEKWMETTSLPTSRVIDTSHSFRADFLHYTSSVLHSHGGKGEHSHEGLDGHTWMDPIFAKAQARAILEAFSGAWPSHADAFQQNYLRLSARFDSLDKRLRGLNQELSQTLVLCSHPAYQYLGKRYKWEMLSFDFDPASQMSAEERSSVLAAIAASNDLAPIMLWESEPLQETQAWLLENGIPSVLYAPCEMLSKSDQEAGVDFFTTMNDNLSRLETALSRH